MILTITDYDGNMAGHLFQQHVVCPTCAETVLIYIVVTKTLNGNTECPKCTSVIPGSAVDAGISKDFKDAVDRTLAEIECSRQEQENTHATE